MSHRPAGHPAVAPYLVVRDAAAQIAFLVDVFGAVERLRHATPEGGIRHAEVAIEESVVMVGERADAAFANSLHVYVPDVDAVYARAIAAGATGLAAPRDLPYGDRSAGVGDPQGTVWWLGTHRATAA
ncbi:VOC family protein [Cognatilysobacter terrigena]|uniref:VOC family protein n=1 Tax=Cognatilysobacter terrigena TaxID=2488749 RepID=UPI00105D1DE4|nr:VOC family protein [Lysobacter terrigena]